MANPKTLDKYEAAAVLTPLAWPIIQGRTLIGEPIPGNNAAAGVNIQYRGTHTTLTTDQYELFRLEVLIPITEQFFIGPFNRQGDIILIEKAIKDLILEVFEDA